MSTASCCSCIWTVGDTDSTSTTGTWTDMDKPSAKAWTDLAPPWWSGQPCSKCCHCGSPVNTEIWYAEFPGACGWCHSSMMNLFRRPILPSCRVSASYKECVRMHNMLQFYKTVIERRRHNGFQKKVDTPNADLYECNLSAMNSDVPVARFDPERVQELRELPFWRPQGEVLQPILSQRIKAVKADVKALTIAQLKPILRTEGLLVPGPNALMQERITNRKPLYDFLLMLSDRFYKHSDRTVIIPHRKYN